METRKVQLSGGTTFTVSLPKQWATEQGISSGSTLYLHPDTDGTLLIEAGTHQKSEHRRVRMDVSGYDSEMLVQAVKSMYLVGVDELVLVERNGYDDDHLETAMDLCADLSGLEIMETTETKLVFQNIIDSSSISIRKSVLRMKLIVLAMHRDAVRAVVNDDTALATRVRTRDGEVDKLFCLVTRQFERAIEDLQTVESLGTTRTELFEYYHTARQFERIADHATKMATLTMELDGSFADETTDEFARVATDARRIVERASEVVLSDVNVTTAFDILSEASDLDAAVNELDKQLYGREDANAAFTVGLLLDSVRRTAAYGRNIAEMGIRQAVKQREHETATRREATRMAER
ncbi:phosphate uptake regulator / ABC transport system regulatory protein [Haloferax mucosum ATCC BAA-1512]|uniref:Phosphate uptake regulator / ABC transport system regulatory protein n=1 Tax=Haloferax mucosum ATCC BAA-1512 TaxID=662479 RepID=M0ICH8_9EURY|nr:phosphate uptake regulator PhoU [Haloferax mucosum]ELZ94485.1 phosphate uptake regulator / ABC transport system regulatory protein [Haloferax mucosum ATCC BAA-1512]